MQYNLLILQQYFFGPAYSYFYLFTSLKNEIYSIFADAMKKIMIIFFGVLFNVGVSQNITVNWDQIATRDRRQLKMLNHSWHSEVKHLEPKPIRIALINYFFNFNKNIQNTLFTKMSFRLSLFQNSNPTRPTYASVCHYLPVFLMS